MRRVLGALKKRFLLPNSQQPFDKLQFLPASLEEENLGCNAKSYEELRNNVSTIIHVSYSTIIGEVPSSLTVLRLHGQ